VKGLGAKVHSFKPVSIKFPGLLAMGLLTLTPSRPALAEADDPLVEQFRAPPQEAKPLVWWHWMNGNVTETGIRLDLQWMQHIGIGGVQNFDGAFIGGGPESDTPLIVQQPLTYMTSAWWQAFTTSLALANRLHLEFSIASSAGWTTTGGPWVSPRDAMKKLVWSETWVEGGRPFKGHLQLPPQTSGAFQNIPVSLLTSRGVTLPIFYADVATIAYQAPATERPLENAKFTVASGAGPMESTRLIDGDLVHGIALPFGNAQQAWIQYTFDRPQKIRALTYVVDRPVLHPLQEPLPAGRLEASRDGHDFQAVAELPQTGRIESSALEQTISFAPAQARVFRVVLDRPAGGSIDAKEYAYRISQLALHTAPRVNRFEDKAGFSTRQITERDDTPEVDPSSVIKKNKIIDLTQKMRPDGSLTWTPLPGRWVVLRFGYSLTGKLNDPASPAGTGLEVDKLDRDAVKRYMDTYLDRYQQALGATPMSQQGLRSIVVDSYEAGPQNWTDRMLEEFKTRRGYDLRPWLPVLAGRVIQSPRASDRLLWDFRQTLGELMREAHYEQITASAHERGLIRYGESHEFGRFLIGDGMEMKKSADVPMGAMLVGIPEEFEHNYAADLRESASVAHLYGRRIVAAESFTTGHNPYGYAPSDLKPVADRMMSEGVNRFAIHTSVHQPDERAGPGLGLGTIGQWFTRKETWANQAQGWVSYLARSSYLLQQGRFLADIAYLYGEDTNLTSLFHLSAPPIPAGYDFDFVNADVLSHELSAQNGRLVSRSGMKYRVLALDPSTRRMSLRVLRAIRELLHAGVVVVGDKPTATPSLADDEHEFQRIADELWCEAPIPMHHCVAHESLGAVLQRTGVAPDVIFQAPPDSTLRFLHRQLEQGDLYFVNHAGPDTQRIIASFRVSGRKPELWRAETGSIELLSYRMEEGRTVVPLDLVANDAVFVLFRHSTSVQQLALPEPKRTAVLTLEGPWEVKFPPSLGAPARARFEKLQSWTERPEQGIKYFSGTASYLIHVPSPPALKPGMRAEIDLGSVLNLAEVRLNGHSLGILWKPPFKMDVTNALNDGDNELEINVTNLWPNRLIGDQQPGAQRIAFAAYQPFKADSPLRASGLIGPVTLYGVERSNRTLSELLPRASP
jgi:hypothetical protein